MPDDNTPPPSFSAGRRWMATLNLLVASAALLGILVMLNYLAQGHFQRIAVANATNFRLSPQTLDVLKAVTNDIRVTIFYKRQAEVYTMVTALLSEYQNANPAHIHVRNIDYDRDPSDAAQLLARLHLGQNQKDFVSFECDGTGQHKICFDEKLSSYDMHDLVRTHEVHRNAFLGELYFTSDLYAVSHPSDLKAYFLTGHGERSPADFAGQPGGYTRLAGILKDEISCDWTNLALSETDSVPADCSLLIIASGEQSLSHLSSNELYQVQTYLQHNGRLLALLDVTEGLDTVLSNWDIKVGTNNILDKDKNVNYGQGQYRVYPAWDSSSSTAHPIMQPLIRNGLYLKMFAPHPVSPAYTNGVTDPGAAKFTAVAATTNGTLLVNPAIPPQSYVLVAAVEKNVVTEHGGTRILVAGDSDFLDDQFIDSGGGANHYFAALGLDWLLQRPDIVSANISSRPIKEYTLSLSEKQITQVRWLFLAGMPGSVLFVGALVWLRRRS